MKKEVKEIIELYLKFEGNKTLVDFQKMLLKVGLELLHDNTDEEKVKLTFIKSKLKLGFAIASKTGIVENLVIDDTQESIEQVWLKWKGRQPGGKKEDWEADEILGVHRAQRKPKKKKEDLGKLVDVGETPYPDRADEYWKEKVKIQFDPNKTDLRRGGKVPAGYMYYDPHFLKEYYDLKSIAFGTWLKQVDCWNYTAALGIGLYDLSQVLGFKPEQISFGGRLSVAFGARGRGAGAAKFETENFVINITRYSRKDKKTKSDFLTSSAGMGAFAHEFAHALDGYLGFVAHTNGKKIEELSGGSSRNTKGSKKLMKQENPAGYMERLLNKIFWKNEKTPSTYYKRLLDNNMVPYFYRRNEIFARAFEVYIQYKMQKRKYFNIFLAERKYEAETYMTLSEVKPLEKDFDQLINSIKAKIKNG
jgi:hypothetical protein